MTIDKVTATALTSYDRPSDAPQSAGSGIPAPVKIDIGNARVRQAAGVGNDLWVGHTTSCQRGTGATEACIRVVRIKVGQNAAGKFTAAVTGTSTIGGSDGDFYFQPGLAVNVAKQAAVAFQTSSRTSKMSAAFSLQDGTTAVFLPAVPLEDGVCTLPATPHTAPGKVRAGDYAGAQTDPVDHTSFWLGAEFAAASAGSPSCQWGTRIDKVTP